MVAVCRDLPFEQRYYDWIAFAPTDSIIWKKLIRTIANDPKEMELFTVIERMRPKEVRKIMSLSEKEFLEGKFTAPYAIQLRANRLYVVIGFFQDLRKLLLPEDFANLRIPEKILNFPVENLLSVTTNEELKKAVDDLEAEVEIYQLEKLMLTIRRTLPKNNDQ